MIPTIVHPVVVLKAHDVVLSPRFSFVGASTGIDDDLRFNPRAFSGMQGHLGWTGELRGPASGLTYLRARDYSPGTGRFTSRDTVIPNAAGTQGYNPYAYTANNPATLTDPSGHRSEAIDIKGVWEWVRAAGRDIAFQISVAVSVIARFVLTMLASVSITAFVVVALVLFAVLLAYHFRHELAKLGRVLWESGSAWIEHRIDGAGSVLRRGVTAAGAVAEALDKATPDVDVCDGTSQVSHGVIIRVEQCQEPCPSTRSPSASDLSPLVMALTADTFMKSATSASTTRAGCECPELYRETKTDRIIRDHLTQADLDAARRELQGEIVAVKPDGTPYDHVKEVREAQEGLLKRIKAIKRQLQSATLTDCQRRALEAELSKASRMLDYSEKFVPRT